MPLLLITATFVIAFFAAGKVISFRSPSVLFLIMQYIMALGTLSRLDANNASDERHKAMLVITFILFSGTTTVLALAEEYRRAKKSQRLSPKIASSVNILPPNKAIVVLMIISVAVCLAYYQAVGYNLLVESLSGNLGSPDTDIAGLRLAAYAGDTYFFPGYVNQFKNVLLPALTTIVIIWLYSSRKPFRLPLSIGFATLCALFLMGTGQRGAMVTFLIVIVLFGAHLGRKPLRRTIFLALAFGIPLFFIGSSVLGRSGGEMAAATGFRERFVVQFNELLSRIMESNQGASLTAFRYIDGQDIQWGSDWFQSFAGLLPGVDGNRLDGEVFAILHGSSRGTSPPSLWTSIFYNFGSLGVVVGAILLGVIYFIVSRKIYLTQSLNTLMAVGMAGVTTLMGTWVAGTPVYLLNTGLIVFVFLWWWGARIKKSGTEGVTSAEPVLEFESER